MKHDISVTYDLEEMVSKGYWCCDLPDLHRYILTAKPDQRFTYYIGRTLQSSLAGKAIGKVVYNYALHGHVYIFQPRFAIDRELFEYICVKASKPPKKVLIPWTEEKLAEKYKRAAVRVEKPNERKSTSKAQGELLSA